MSTRATSIVIATVVLLSSMTGFAGGQPQTAADVDVPKVATPGENGVVAQTATADTTLSSGGTYWQGQQLRLDASSLLDSSDGGRTFEVWRVTEDGRLNHQVGSFDVGEGGEHVLDTSPFDGRVVLRYSGEPVYIHDGQAYLESPPDGGAVTVDASAFHLGRQTLSFAWSDPTTYSGQRVTLTVESNRANSVVAVSGANLTFQQLTTVFPEAAFASDHDARSNDSELLLELDGSTSMRLQTDEIAPGERTLQFDVVDTTTSEAAALDVLEPDGDRHFDAIERREHVGDVIEANLTCDHCFLVVGGYDQGLLDIVEIQDANGDGTVELRMNTRYMGMLSSASGYPSGVQAYSSPDDEVTRYSASDELESVTSKLITVTSSLGDLRAKIGLEPRGRLRPLAPRELRLTLASSDFVVDRSDWGNQAPYGSDLVVRDETDVRTVSLEPRSLDGIEVVSAPGGGAYDGTARQLRSVAGPRDSVALGDRLAVRIDVSGVHGYLSANDVSVEDVMGSQGEGLSVSVERVDGEEETSIQLNRMASSIVRDPEGDALYLVMRTGDGSPNWLKAGEYRATFTLDGIDEEYTEYSTKQGYDGYPYLPPGEEETVSVSGRIEAPTATITDPEPGSSPRLSTEGTLEVDGATNVAGGASLTVVIGAAEYAWETEASPTVDADGTWSTSFDLAEAPGERFQVRVLRGGDQLTSADYTVRPPAEGEGNSTDESGSSGDGGGQAGSGGPVAGGGGILGTLTGLAGPVGAGVGGLVVLWGTWRLLIRRILFS